MVDFKIPLKMNRFVLKNQTFITVELAIAIPRSHGAIDISIQDIRACLSFVSKEGENIVVDIKVPGSVYSIPQGPPKSYRIVSHTVEIEPETAACPAYRFQFAAGKPQSDYLSGVITGSPAGYPVLVKWRVIVEQDGFITKMPWSTKEKCLSTSDAALTVQEEKTDVFMPNKEFIDLLINCECPTGEIVPGANLLFAWNIGNRGNKKAAGVEHHIYLKPSPGVLLEVVSDGDAAISPPIGRILHPGDSNIFSFSGTDLLPGMTITRKIIIKLLEAPIGSSLIENSAVLFWENDGYFFETADNCTLEFKIDPPPDQKKIKASLLHSLAQEEVGLCNILNWEAEKIKKAVSLAEDVTDILGINDSVQDTLKGLVKYQLLMAYKLEDALKMR